MNRKFHGSLWRRFMASSYVRSGEVRPYFVSDFFVSAQVLSNFLKRSYSFSPFGPRNGRSEDTRLNSSHSQISYAVFCLKKKKKKNSNEYKQHNHDQRIINRDRSHDLTDT